MCNFVSCSHASRGNTRSDALRPVLWTQSVRAAFPRKAWERDKRGQGVRFSTPIVTDHNPARIQCKIP